MNPAPVPGKTSWLHRWDARVKLVSFFAVMLVCATVQTLSAAACAFLGACVLLLMSGVTVRAFVLRLGAVMAFLVPGFLLIPLTAPGPSVEWLGLSLSLHGLQLSLLLALRALSVVALTMALLQSTPPPVLLRAAEQLRCPPVLVQVALLAYRYLFSLRQELSRMRSALQTRAFADRPSWSSYQVLARMVGITLIRSLERTERIRQAMYCRGYRGRMVSLDPFALRRADWGWAAGVGTWMAALLLIDLRGWLI